MKDIRSYRLSCFILIFAVMISLFGCTKPRRHAVLHKEDQNGYIPCVSTMADVGISSEQAFVYDIASESFSYLKGEKNVIYPASTTKLLTIVYALTLLSPDELVTPGDEIELVKEGSSLAYVNSKHTLTVEMLIEGMLLPSGNDAAYALAAAAGRKLSSDTGISGKEAVALFIDGLNAYARQMGLCGSNFESPDGYWEKSHYSTVEDIALVAAAAYKNEIIRKYCGMHSDDVVYASGQTNHWTNTNLMLDKNSKYYDSRVTGLKTGSLGRGNYSLICSVEFRNGSSYIVGIFSSATSNSRYDDMLTIINALDKISV